MLLFALGFTTGVILTSIFWFYVFSEYNKGLKKKEEVQI